MYFEVWKYTGILNGRIFAAKKAIAWSSTAIIHEKGIICRKLIDPRLMERKAI